MEVALRQRLDGVADISISQSRQSAEVGFAPGAGAFVPAEFRAAVGQAGVQVLSFEIDACGVVETQNGSRSLHAGDNRFVLAEADHVPIGQPLCLAGRLDDSVDPPRLTVTNVKRS